MKSSPVISVIIPVYNRERYLPACIESILGQQIEDLEILIIDDGSTDASWQIIQDYAKQFSNIITFRQERKRQGAARNVGLDHARGQYVAFVDSDDMVPPNTYRNMYAMISEHHSDLVTGIKMSFQENRRWLFNSKRSWITIEEHRRFFTRIRPNISLEELPELLADISVCNKLYDRSFLQRHNLRFVEDSAGEDIDFMAKAYVLAKKITILPFVVYHYRGVAASRTSRIHPSFFADRVRVTHNLEAFFQKHGKRSLYPVLRFSEVRKLVKGRLTRVITTLPYEDQLQVFKTIRKLLPVADVNQILESPVTLSHLARIRLLFLADGEYDALILYTLQPNISLDVRRLVPNPVLQDALAELLPLQQRENNKTISDKTGVLHFGKALLIRGYHLYMRAKWIPRRIVTRRTLALALYCLARGARMLRYGARRDFSLWLIDERISTSAEDNSFVLYQYLKKHTDITAYYVIINNSPDLEKIRPLGGAVIQYSFKHALLLARAGVLLSTDRMSSLAFPFRFFPGMWKETHNVFLQHGVAGNKTMTYYKSRYPYFSQVIVSNEIERKFFVQEYGFSKQEVSVTGIARFDKLVPGHRTLPKRKILIAPTWRKWLRTPQRVETSKYLFAWNRLMTDHRLIELAEINDLTLYFRPHFNMIRFIDKFETGSNQIKILQKKNICLQEYIQQCDLLITDYSSVMYDFFFQEKPVICFMFDRIHWELQPPGPPHIDFDRDLPASVVDSPAEVLDALEAAVDGNFMMNEREREKAARFFSFRDHRNCERIFRSVQNRVSARFSHQPSESK